MQPSPFRSYSLKVHRNRSYTEPRSNVDNVTSKSYICIAKSAPKHALLLRCVGCGCHLRLPAAHVKKYTYMFMSNTQQQQNATNFRHENAFAGRVCCVCRKCNGFVVAGWDVVCTIKMSYPKTDGAVAVDVKRFEHIVCIKAGICECGSRGDFANERENGVALFIRFIAFQ